MEPAELEEALEDLETRLERLRALYEQYFLGIEKVPPAVARNDVDRRIWALRKVQIRNTAKRFKLQTIVQRYNTFQQYWTRICREIEDGTYSPHLARARKHLDPDKALTIATRRRLGMYRRSSAPPAEDARDKALREAESELTAALTQPEPAPVPLADAWQDPRLSLPAAGGSNAARAKALAPATRSSPADAWRDPREKPSTTATTSSGPRGLGAPSALASRRPQGAAGTRSDRAGGPSGPLPPPRSLPAPTTPSRRPGTSLEPVTLQFVPEPPVQVARSDQRASPPQSPPPRPTAPKQAPSPSTPRAAEPRTLPRSPLERTPAGGTRLTPAGVEQLHRQLVEAKRRNNDAGSIDLNELRSRLEKTERQLRSQHGDRPIEFAVVVKNGRAMIKPTVR
ncbi:MAG: hypothetical protein JW940_23285 [Polyangiaceae bacterium]|nr:hypothetical protein [Polyangiaceae bacterium]